MNIRDYERLNEAERKLTQLRLNDLITSPVDCDFDLRHLQHIHKYLFQDLYSWAGKIRTVDIAKSNMFCKVQFIMVQAEEVFEKLKSDNYLSDLSKEQFIRELAIHQGYILHFSRITKTSLHSFA